MEKEKIWTRLYGTYSGGNWGYEIASDKSGNIYVTGTAAGSIDGQPFAGGSGDVVLTKYRADGTRLWTRLSGTSGWDQGYGVCTDASGNIFVSGYTEGPLDGQPHVALGDIFVMKYDCNGTKAWTRTTGNLGWDFGGGVTADNAGNVFVTGYIEGYADGLYTVGTGGDMILMKYSPEGSKLWTRLSGSDGWDFGKGVSLDTMGNVYVTGTAWGSLDGQLFAGGMTDMFLMKYDTNGAKVWTRLSGSNGADMGHRISIDVENNIYISGHANGVLDGQPYYGGGAVTFLMKYDGSGNKAWTRVYGNQYYDSVWSDYLFGVSADNKGNIFVLGATKETAEAQSSYGVSDIFIMKYYANGTSVWRRLLGSHGSWPQSNAAYGVTVDNRGNVYVTGCSQEAIDGQPFSGNSAILVMKFNDAESSMIFNSNGDEQAEKLRKMKRCNSSA